MKLDEQCRACIYLQSKCPLRYVADKFAFDQEDFNIDVDELTSGNELYMEMFPNGCCKLYELAKSDFYTNPAQMTLL